MNLYWSCNEIRCPAIHLTKSHYVRCPFVSFSTFFSLSLFGCFSFRCILFLPLLSCIFFMFFLEFFAPVPSVAHHHLFAWACCIYYAYAYLFFWFLPVVFHFEPFLLAVDFDSLIIRFFVCSVYLFVLVCLRLCCRHCSYCCSLLFEPFLPKFKLCFFLLIRQLV